MPPELPDREPDEPSEPREDADEAPSSGPVDGGDKLGRDVRRYHADRGDPLSELRSLFGDASPDDPTTQAEQAGRNQVLGDVAEWTGGDTARCREAIGAVYEAREGWYMDRVEQSGPESERDVWHAAMRTSEEILQDLETHMLDRWGIDLYGDEPS
jgi:hypothetical protein